ncbi:MAG: glucose 1-dehydrogenase [Hyphomicrobiaceae bacterium]|nr:glucose 1-dehydrogenase [Hyphomicrobiaceae bacterium]
MGQLDGKVAIITGATSGIGARTAQIFAEEGAKVVLTGRRQAEGQAVAAGIGADALFIKADATLEDDWRRVIDSTLQKFGRLDALFNNAGGPAPTGSITSVPVEGFDAAMALLVRSVMLGIKHAAPHLMRQRSGSIINNGSIAGHQAGYSSSMIYGAAKAAVNHLSRCAAMELGEYNVRVNSISPGAIATGIVAKALGMEAGKADKIAAEVARHSAKVQPIPRAGLTDDIANCAVFLASDKSSFINGIDIIVDGGLLGGRQYTPHQQSLKALKGALGI